MLCAAPGRPQGKVRAGPFHADAGSLCQQLLAYLPPPCLFAFGEAPAGWGLGRPGSRSLGAGRALSGHLLQLLAAPEDREPWGGRDWPKTPGAQLRPVSRVLTPARLPTLQAGLGRGTSSDWGRKREAGGCAPGVLSSAPASRLGRDLTRAAVHPELPLRISEEVGKKESSHCPTFHRPGNPSVAPASLSEPGLY